MERSVLQGLGVFRWAAWAWLAIVVVVSPGDLVREWLAAGLVGVTFGFTALCWAWRDRPERLFHPAMVATELALGAVMLSLDGLVRPPGEVFASGQSLASVWPLTGVISAAIVFGPVGAGIAGAGLGLCRYLSTVLNDVTDYGDGRAMSLMSTAVMYALAGAAFGYVYRLLRRAREEIAAAEAREEIARTLHDGVLQTLALIERRAGDPALTRLARDQERELRAYLFGDRQATTGDLGAALRACASRFEQTFDGRVDVLVPDDLPPLSDRTVHAIAGAVGESLTNAGKHGGARRIVVFVDYDEAEVFCSVKDDGKGFDAASMVERIGWSSSIRGRVEGVGGRADLASTPGSGAEVRLRVPRRPG